MKKSEIVIFLFSAIPAWQTYNALFAVRCILKYLLETVGEEEMIKHTEAGLVNEQSPNCTISRIEQLISVLFDMVIDVPLW